MPLWFLGYKACNYNRLQSIQIPSSDTLYLSHTHFSTLYYCGVKVFSFSLFQCLCHLEGKITATPLIVMGAALGVFVSNCCSLDICWPFTVWFGKIIFCFRQSIHHISHIFFVPAFISQLTSNKSTRLIDHRLLYFSICTSSIPLCNSSPHILAPRTSETS